MKRLLSLFDYTGQWAAPFYEGGGWDVIPWDIKTEEFMDINLFDSAETVLDMFEYVDALLIAQPCTDFAVSGARWWSNKDADGRTEKSLELVNQSLRLVDLFTPTDPDYDGTWFWALENPVGRLGKITPIEEMYGKPYYFNPFEFAGHIPHTADDLAFLEYIRAKNGVNVTTTEAEHIIYMNAYTKKTGLWGCFNRNLVKKPIAPVQACPQGSPLQRLGGKSEKTKEVRSNTPEGFALAFYEANKDHKFEYAAA
jgi:hypothetical protein